MYDVVSGVQKVWKRDKKLESRATKKGAEKLVSSDVAKIPEKKVAINIRETCEKTMFTPSNPNKATYKSYRYCLAMRMLPNRQNEFSDIRSSDRQREFSDIFLPDQKRCFSDKRSEIASDQNDA
jgi:hypothetical protein